MYELHGDIENKFRAAAGHGFDALTASEARYLTNYRPLDAIRDRITEAARRTGEGVPQDDAGKRDDVSYSRSDKESDELEPSKSQISRLIESAIDHTSQAIDKAGNFGGKGSAYELLAPMSAGTQKARAVAQQCINSERVALPCLLV